MSKDKKTTKKQNVENVENVDNWREYFNENFETIEMTIKYAKEIKFILERVIAHLQLNKKFPQNLYISALETIISWIDTSIELHYRNQEFLLQQNKDWSALPKLSKLLTQFCVSFSYTEQGK